MARPVVAIDTMPYKLSRRTAINCTVATVATVKAIKTVDLTVEMKDGCRYSRMAPLTLLLLLLLYRRTTKQKDSNILYCSDCS